MFRKAKVLKSFWHYWMQFPRLFILSLLLGPVLAVQYVVVPLFVALGLSELVRSHHVSASIMAWAAVSLAIALILGYIINIRCDTELEHKVEEKMYDDCFRHLVYQDYDFFANNFSGALVTRANRFVRGYSIFHFTFFNTLLPQLFSVVFIFGVLLYFNITLGFSILALWLISVSIIIQRAVNRIPLRRTAVAKESEQTGELADVLTNSLTVKTFASEEREVKRYHATNKLRGDYFMRSWRRAVQNGWLVETFCGVLQIAVFIGGIIAVERHVLSLAIFLLFQVYILRVVDNLRQASMIVRQFEGVFGDAQEMVDLFDRSPEVQDSKTPLNATITQGEIAFRNVTFSYPETDQNKETLFENFSLTIKSGERVGLVGPSGGGKTTITKLLLRFMDPQSGEIVIDGHNIRAMKQDQLRSAMAYVAQEPLLFHRSIKDNILYGNPNASEEAVIQAAEHAHAHAFIKKLPRGYDTLVGERGVKLSGGQRQRVAIARAILKDAPILLLDEATSALDSGSELAIQAALWELMKERTALVIAHRLSTIQRLDRIIVLDEGKIVEQGGHEELIAADGLYAKLWKHQSGGFLQD